MYGKPGWAITRRLIARWSLLRNVVQIWDRSMAAAAAQMLPRKFGIARS
jgi:hypothetical protein